MADATLLETQTEQLAREKRAVSYDSYDISVRQIVDMADSNEISISPEYQRHFIWEEVRESELIESIFLGIPVPSLFMATNSDGTWEVVDGVQRISTILHFIGNEKSLRTIGKQRPLTLQGLNKLSSFNTVTFESLQQSNRLQFLTRPLRVTTLNDKSDSSVRYDLFERLNTGAVKLHPQEIRNCVYRGQFTAFLKELATEKSFRGIVKIPKNEVQTATYEECALRFFAFRDKYTQFGHNVQEFLNNYVIEVNKAGGAVTDPKNFIDTMEFIRGELPNGITRTNRQNITPINLYEAVAVGTSLAISSGKPIHRGVLQNIINDDELKGLTTGGTNSKPMVTGRIEYIRDRLVG